MVLRLAVRRFDDALHPRCSVCLRLCSCMPASNDAYKDQFELTFVCIHVKKRHNLKEQFSRRNTNFRSVLRKREKEKRNEGEGERLFQHTKVCKVKKALIVNT